MFMVVAASVYDKRIKFLVRDVSLSLSILNIYNQSAPTCKSRGQSLMPHSHGLISKVSLRRGNNWAGT